MCHGDLWRDPEGCVIFQVPAGAVAGDGAVCSGHSAAAGEGALDAAPQVRRKHCPHCACSAQAWLAGASTASHKDLLVLSAQQEGRECLLTPGAWRRHADHEVLQPASSCTPRNYPAPDGEVSFSLNDSLYRSGTNHDHDQPPHLRLRNGGLPSSLNWPVYAGPESRYCPAGVLLSLAAV